MAHILDYMRLPPEVTPFEQRYLTRLNKIALIFFYAHVPALMAVAWVADTDPTLALTLSLGLLVGPTIAYFTLDSLRGVSLVYGVTAMLMGGLLVHFGQGPVQIEMHFYFFALLAMLCMFANPMVNIVAAIIVAIHHGVLWWFLPTSVFNYDAEWWVVGVHAVFVVLETVAACFISRQFFDNVIGLEKIVEARTTELREKQRDMRLILDNVDQGLVTIDLDGVMSNECSEAVRRWFGDAKTGTTLPAYLAGHDARFSEWLELALESVKDGMLPPEVAIGQIPSRLQVGECTYDLGYRPIEGPGGRIEKLLVIITNITERLRKEDAERHQRELLHLFQHIMRDKVGFLEFLSEADEIMDSLHDSESVDLSAKKRLLHTLKGNASIFGMHGLAEICHDLENKIVEEQEAPTSLELEALGNAWRRMRDDLDRLLGERRDSQIELEDADYEAILQAVLDGVDREIVASMIASWRLEPTHRRLGLVEQQLRGLAQRLGKGGLAIEVDTFPGDIRIKSDHFARFWSAFIHVLRNAVDHGIERPPEREAVGKSGAGRVAVTAAIEEENFVISVADDGRGIDWDGLRAKALELGLEPSLEEKPEEILFVDGVSTKESVTLFSGRGVGMGAMRAACEAIGGRIELQSERGVGTTIRFVFPVDECIYGGHSAVLETSVAA